MNRSPTSQHRLKAGKSLEHDNELQDGCKRYSRASERVQARPRAERRQANAERTTCFEWLMPIGRKTDAPHRRIVLLGKIQEEQALLIVDKTQFDSNEMSNFVASLADVSDLGSNDIYTWLVGNTRPTETSKDLKMTLLCPCTAVVGVQLNVGQQAALICITAHQEARAARVSLGARDARAVCFCRRPFHGVDSSAALAMVRLRRFETSSHHTELSPGYGTFLPRRAKARRSSTMTQTRRVALSLHLT